MAPRVSALALAALLALPAGAAAQDLRSPIGPQVPPTPEERRPAPAPSHGQGQTDDEFGTSEVLILLGVGGLLVGGTFIGLRFEMSRRQRRREGERRRRRARSGRSAAAFRSGAHRQETGEDAKAPPPPPRKQHARRKSKRR